jgi:hypothetical protein
MGKVMEALFGCWHLHYSFPITVKPASRRNRAAMLTGTYVVCLDCGKEFAYDWEEMRVVSGTRNQSRTMHSLATKEAA